MFCKVRWAQSSIDLPGSLHTNNVPVILGRYFCRQKIVSLYRDNGTFDSSNADPVEKLSFWWLLHNIGGASSDNS